MRPLVPVPTQAIGSLTAPPPAPPQTPLGMDIDGLHQSFSDISDRLTDVLHRLEL